MRTLRFLKTATLVGLFCVSAQGQLVDLDRAENFTIEKREDYTLLTIPKSSQSAQTPVRYALVPKDQEVPALPKHTRVVRTPVERVVVLETVHIGFLEAIDRLPLIVGAGSTNYISNPAIRKGLADGSVLPVQNGTAIDVERLLSLRPDLVLTSDSPDLAPIHPQIARAGIPIVYTASYLEAEPLARAEWIKFFGVLLDASETATRAYDGALENYEAHKNLAERIGSRPTVLAGAPYGGVWHVPGGRSFVAKLIKDAGGAYIWADDKTVGAIPLDTERVFFAAAHADVWIHPSHYRTRDDLLAADPRFEGFAAAKDRAIYNNTRRLTPTGGNPFWESAVVRPDEVLADLIQILHPGSLPDRELIYYELLSE